MSVGYPDFGGTAPVNAPVNVYNVNGNGVLPGNSAVLGPFNMSGQSYSIKFDPQQGAAGTVPFCEINVQVIDSAGFVTEDILYEMAMSPTILDMTYAMQGPFNGSTLAVTVENQDTVEMFYNISINTNNTPLSEHTNTTIFWNSIMAGFTIPPNVSPRKGLLATNSRSALGAGASDRYILPPVPGPITVSIHAVTPANVLQVLLAPYVATNGYAGINGGNSIQFVTDANGNGFGVLNVMRCSYDFRIKNTGAAPTDYFLTASFDVTSG